MEKQSMTALVSAFARAYHTQHNEVKIFDDPIAEKIITEDEYSQISSNMSQGISFFNPEFVGTKDEALRFIVDRFLSPAPLGRAAFAERMLEHAVKLGTQQYLIFAAGLDTFAYRQPEWAKNLQIFEIDHPDMSSWKQSRMHSVTEEVIPNLHFIGADFSTQNWQESLAGSSRFCKEAMSFCSLLGISYYLTESNFSRMIEAIAGLIPKGSRIVFDYPAQDDQMGNTSGQENKLARMAGAAGEAMLASYRYDEMEKLLSDRSFLIRQHLKPDEIAKQYFRKYNETNPKYPMTASDHVNYCLAVTN
jgi:methyltransferase (TIGR00027 family)